MKYRVFTLKCGGLPRYQVNQALTEKWPALVFSGVTVGVTANKKPPGVNRRAPRQRHRAVRGFLPCTDLEAPLISGSQVRALVRPPPSLQVSNSAGDTRICPVNSGLFEFVLVSASVSARQKGGSGPSVSASKNSVPDSGVRDRFDDWVVGLQFVPDYLHHPVSANRTFPIRGQIGPFCGDFRLALSRILCSAGRTGCAHGSRRKMGRPSGARYFTPHSLDSFSRYGGGIWPASSIMRVQSSPLQPVEGQTLETLHAPLKI